MVKYVYIKMFYGCLYIVVSSLLMRQSKGISIVVTNTSGIITSPNYPNEYNNDFDCEYIIRSPTKQPITLVFEDFEIEDDDDCTKDYVSVKDGDNILLGTFCGDDTPYPLLALSGVIILKFHSNNEETEKGFRVVFNDSQECVYVTTDSNGTIQSPNYPYNYPTNIICLFYIESRKGISINITFTNFDLGYSSRGCTNDYVIVRDGVSQSSKQLGKFCGRRIPQIPVIFSGTVFVIFRSNKVASWSGFNAEYKEYKEEPLLDCSGLLNASVGRIQSPKHPEEYDSNTDCEYTLASKYNGLINLTFTFFEMENPHRGNCAFDFVEIYDSNTSIGKFCGFQKPVLTFILSSSVRVVFHSDNLLNFRGFSANFAEITVHQTTHEVLTTVSVSLTSGNMRNNKITPSTNTSSVNPVIIGAATGALIGMVVVITIICVIVGRKKRTEMESLKRRNPAKPMEKSCHVYHNVVNIDHCSTTNSAEYSMENPNTDLETEIHTSDIEMNEECIVNDEENNEYVYSNLLTDDTSTIKHHADNSYHNLSDNYNEVQEIQIVIKHFKKDDSEYMDQGEAYNILNIHPQKINDTENFYRTIEDVYDRTTYTTNTSYSDVGLYDHSSNN